MSPSISSRRFEPKVGQVWRNSAGDLVRIQGFTKLRPVWVQVRLIGGARWRASYPPNAFTSGAFTLVEEAPDA